MKKIVELKKWQFSIEKLNVKKQITLPHTWNVDEKAKIQLYRGKAVYECTVKTDEINNKKFILYFGCAYHTATVWVNETLVGVHKGSGYTPFEFDVTKYVKLGQNNIKVEIDNHKSKNMLPYLLNFDWADDGGLTRDVRLNIYDKTDFTDIAVSYEIQKIHNNLCTGTLNIKAVGAPNVVDIIVNDFNSGETVIRKTAFVNNSISIAFENLKLWDVNTPNLYTITLKNDNFSLSKRVGFRTIEVKGTKILLNEKIIYLKGCEWMPGSDPNYGMAEPIEISQKYLRLLKDANCVFTRFHWQQDDSLFDWCDENGLLVQEEIPYWGCPKKANAKQFEIAKNQADAMVKYHAHHPSIICWGVGNELGGRTIKTTEYVKNMYSYFKSLDSSRLVNYVSNTLPIKKRRFEQNNDATLYGDIAMWNDYLGLWLKSKNVKEDILNTYKQCGNMPSVISEFGLCEPFFDGGDERRAEILKNRVKIYKTLPNIVGYVWFSLNDYRTQCGEDGKGKMRQRVHGSTDLYGNPKPSYNILKEL